MTIVLSILSFCAGCVVTFAATRREIAQIKSEALELILAPEIRLSPEEVFRRVV